MQKAALEQAVKLFNSTVETQTKRSEANTALLKQQSEEFRAGQDRLISEQCRVIEH